MASPAAAAAPTAAATAPSRYPEPPAYVWGVGSSSTISQKNALLEFKPLTKEDLDVLPCRWRSFHGNSYRLFSRDQVAQRARELYGSVLEVNLLTDKLVQARQNVVQLEMNFNSAKELVASLEAQIISKGGQLPVAGAKKKKGRPTLAEAAAKAVAGHHRGVGGKVPRQQLACKAARKSAPYGWEAPVCDDDDDSKGKAPYLTKLPRKQLACKAARKCAPYGWEAPVGDDDDESS